MVDVIPADTDDIPSKILDETWDLPFHEDCPGLELVCIFPHTCTSISLLRLYNDRNEPYHNLKF